MLWLALVIASAALAAVLLTRPGPYVYGLSLLATDPKVSYTAGGPYVGPDPVNNVVHNDPTMIVIGRDGLPWVNYTQFDLHVQNPVTIAQYGLRAYSRYVLHDHEADRADALRAGRWLLAHQHRNGEWIYTFPADPPGVRLKPPWASALAQGQAISLFERLYRLTGHHVYLSAALRAFQSLRQPVSRGGFLSCYRGNCRLPFLEEYVARKPVNVINGFMFVTIGLYDLASIAPHSGARQLYLECRRTIARALPSYNGPHGVAYYDQVSKQLAGQAYQAVYVYLLRALNQISPNAEFRHWASVWQSNMTHAPVY